MGTAFPIEYCIKKHMAFAMDLVLLLSPLIITISLLGLSNLFSKSNKVKFHEITYKLNPRQGLWEQWPLRFWLLLVLSYFFLTGILCWKDYSLDLSEEGFRKFIEISKLPLGVLSLTIPAGALISKLHSTQQTAMQILLTESNNNLSSYYNHRKNLTEYINSIGQISVSPSKEIKIKVNQQLYNRLYKNSSPANGAGTPDPHIMNNLIQLISACVGYLDRLHREELGQEERESHYFYLSKHTYEIMDQLAIFEEVKLQYDHFLMQHFCDPDDQFNPEKESISIRNVCKDFHDFMGIFKYSIAILMAIAEESRSIEPSAHEKSMLERLNVISTSLDFLAHTYNASKSIDDLTADPWRFLPRNYKVTPGVSI